MKYQGDYKLYMEAEGGHQALMTDNHSGNPLDIAERKNDWILEHGDEDGKATPLPGLVTHRSYESVQEEEHETDDRLNTMVDEQSSPRQEEEQSERGSADNDPDHMVVDDEQSSPRQEEEQSEHESADNDPDHMVVDAEQSTPRQEEEQSEHESAGDPLNATVAGDETKNENPLADDKQTTPKRQSPSHQTGSGDGSMLRRIVDTVAGFRPWARIPDRRGVV